MTPRARHRQGSITRRLTVWLAVLPFLLASLIVPGNMLARDAAGGVTVVLCAGGDMVEMVMAADGSVKPAQSPDGDQHPCHWAPHNQPLLQAAPTAALPPVPQPHRIARAAERPGHLHRAVVRAAPARGPPSLV